MATVTHDFLESWEVFDWQPQPRAADFIRQTLDAFCADCPPASTLAESLRRETGTRLSDWIDHIALPGEGDLEQRLRDLGFVSSHDDRGMVWDHSRGLFPPIYQRDRGPRRVGIKVESVPDFLIRHGIGGTHIDGAPLAPLRKAKIGSGRDTELWVVERHGYPGWEPPEITLHKLDAVLWHGDRFRRRKREFADEEAGFDHARRLLRAAVEDLGAGRACDLFFSAEREFWTSRNRAARLQKARQDALGLGWANHDHHTYRSSRECFVLLIGVFEELGLECRERFYAGKEAGWGAQVLEQQESSVVVFADVDLGPDEVAGDFAHQTLDPATAFGTVGLWCKLHGQAFLQAGMHHLECRFDIDAAREQLQQAGIEVMKPFTDLPHLKQAFTQGEVWPPDPSRIASALAAGAITREQADQFQQSGAIGSHLELLQRDEGYKGFNKSGISEIIRDTDPRKRHP